MELRLLVYLVGTLFALIGCVVAAWTRDKLGMALMTVVLVLLAWIGRGLFMSS